MPPNDALSIWVIYDHPSDFPNCFVAKRFEYETPTADLMVAADLSKIQDSLAAMGLMKLMRMPGDDPVILETWL